MEADIYRFAEFAGSARGLQARPILPSGEVALLEDILSITYISHNKTNNVQIADGSLTPADVMYAAAQPWDRDDEGYTFGWQAPGSLWPVAGKVYRIVVTYLTTPAAGSLQFTRVWEVQAKNTIA